jgi:hypothetical protein
MVSNVRATVTLTVTLPPGLDMGWVYFVPRNPGFLPMRPFAVSASNQNASGVAVVTTFLPVGSYTTLLLDHLYAGNLRDPQVVARFTGGAKSVEVTAGGSVSLRLEPAQEKND